MVRFQRSLRIAPNKDLEAITWSKEITTFLNGKYSETNVQVFAQRFHRHPVNAGTSLVLLHALQRHHDVAALDDALHQTHAIAS